MACVGESKASAGYHNLDITDSIYNGRVISSSARIFLSVGLQVLYFISL